ncbi:MFS transporter [Acidihalobacter yilgarnensis]|uniref:MFS transporter n=1 Tax=Acidihalobacter yilgarnensis TaxID=2819280 RepID=UPI0012E9A5BC|nr:MFS transporter [Acidihalobacter yilgarnensis]
MFNVQIKPSPRTPASRPWVKIALLALGTFTVGTDAFIVASILPGMAKTLDVTPTVAGQAVTVFAITYAIAAPVLAALTGAYSRRRVLIAALLTLATANLAAATAHDLGTLLASRALAALGAAVYTPTAGALAASLYAPRYRGRALSVVIGGLTLATALGVPLGGLLAHWLNWRAALAVISLLALLVAATHLHTLAGQPNNTAPAKLGERLTALRTPGVTSTLVLTVTGMAASYTLYPYSLPLLHDLGIPAYLANPMLFLYGAGALVGNLFCGHATDRWGPARVLAAAYLAMCMAFGLMIACLWMQTAQLTLTAIAVTLWGASTWSQTPPQQHRLIALSPDTGHLLIALNASAIYLGIGIGAVLGGLAIHAGAPAVLLTGLSLALYAWLQTHR